MKEKRLEVISIGISDTSEAPIGKNIFYKCQKCEDVMQSNPQKNIRCQCGNIDIDKDIHRLWVEDYSSINILKVLNNKIFVDI